MYANFIYEIFQKTSAYLATNVLFETQLEN